MKSIKNIALEPISVKYLGLTLLPNQQIEAHPQEYDLWVVAATDDTIFINDIFNNRIKVYDDDGVINNFVDAIWHLKRLQTKQEAYRTPFNSQDTHWTNAIDAQQAIEDCYRISTVEGHFSYRIIEQNITIPFNEQMVVYQQFCIVDNVELNLLGEVVVL